jgi:hypothetical protein
MIYLRESKYQIQKNKTYGQAATTMRAQAAGPGFKIAADFFENR